jgi:ABC-type nitrate/sulfonate/bicarbonate transport system substrate-binding protein
MRRVNEAIVELRVGGVPEHFNLPWHLAMEAGSLRQAGFDLDWTDYTTGTGAMLADLVEGKLDLAILLTEGAALGVARELPVRPFSLYTTSPLIWGVHVAPDSGFSSLDELANARFGISRYGSGSHLMSLAMAIERNWPVSELRFEIVDNLPGAIVALAGGRADVFLWEHFTTEPAVEAGHFRRIGDFVSPWPAWVVCARSELFELRSQALESLVKAVARQAESLVASADAAALIAGRYGLREAAVAEWLGTTRWVSGPTAPDEALAAASRMLQQAGAI